MNLQDVNDVQDVKDVNDGQVVKVVQEFWNESRSCESGRVQCPWRKKCHTQNVV